METKSGFRVLQVLALLAIFVLLTACGSSGTTPEEEADITGTQDIGGDPEKKCEDVDQDGFFAGDGCQAGLIQDCDDLNAQINPTAPEVCGNDVDENCDGQMEADCPDKCEDKDQDGHIGLTTDCPKGDDCVDTNDAIHPDATEICGNGVDEDCSGADLECPPECKDLDGDGHPGVTGECPEGSDCNDGDDDVYPGAVEVCGNGEDDDCEGGDAVCPEECVDMDGDGYGVGPDCVDYDCNDGNDSVHPGAQEVCGNSLDDDCVDGDENCPDVCEDLDQDGFGVGGACTVQDCDDTNPDAFPGNEEICGNNVDENCNGEAEECICLDKDGDGYGAGDSCDGPDCDDSNPDVNPAQSEVCGNGLDDDCSDGDQECQIDCADVDGDGYGAGADCLGPDCNDADPEINPAADDVCENNIDEDCSGSDDDCPAPNCADDWDCDANMLCDQSTGTCRFAKVWEWWAPSFFVDTDPDGYGLDLPRAVNFDGDWNAKNNFANLDTGNADAVIYYSFVKTSTHWYLGYYLFFPQRWTSWFLGTKYENTMRGVLLVVEQDGSMYGKPVLMETLTEDSFFQYVPDANSLSGQATKDGNINYDFSYPSDHHPVVYVHSQDHGIWGDDYLWNNVSYWDINGFPGDDGVVYRFGAVSELPVLDNDEVYYSLEAVFDSLWPHRNDVGNGKLFDEFGHFNYASSTNYKALAPWRLYDSNFPNNPEGEMLYDPADFVRRHFNSGWGSFSFTYMYNPYVIKVTLKDLQVMVTADPFSGLAEPFFNLYTWDGGGYQILALSNFYGFQNNWTGSEKEVGYIYDLAVEMGGRNYFYGFPYPTDSYFGLQVRDYDGGWSGDDWLMDVKETHYYKFSGQDLLDWGKSNSIIKVEAP